MEQNLINESIKFDPQSQTIIAKLSFIHNPAVKLAPNKNKALKIYQQQLKKLNNESNLGDKMDIIKSENKLQELGFVNLSPEMQHKLNHQHQHYIAWRAVWKKSVSTPCRIVFDASQPTSSGFSLNDILAKGRNNLNKLQEIVIRWFTHKFAITTDIRKMTTLFTSTKTSGATNDTCDRLISILQNLHKTKLSRRSYTLIYGVRSSGN